MQAESYNKSLFLPRTKRAIETCHTFSVTVQYVPNCGTMTTLLLSLPNHRIPLPPVCHMISTMMISVAHVHVLRFLLRDVTSKLFLLSQAGYICFTHFGWVEILNNHNPHFPKLHNLHHTLRSTRLPNKITVCFAYSGYISDYCLHIFTFLSTIVESAPVPTLEHTFNLIGVSIN